jgi:hypothetical protein
MATVKPFEELRSFADQQFQQKVKEVQHGWFDLSVVFLKLVRSFYFQRIRLGQPACPLWIATYHPDFYNPMDYTIQL